MCRVGMTEGTSWKKKLKTKEYASVFLIIFNSFSWYFPLYIFFVNAVESLQLEYNIVLFIFSIHYIAVVAFAVIGDLLSSKIGSKKLLSSWIFIGVIVSALMYLLSIGGIEWIYFISFSLGVSLGLGFPSCLTFFADHTAVEYRGSFGGVTYFLTCTGMFLIGFVGSTLDFTANVLVFTLWRMIGLVFFLYLGPKESRRTEAKEVNYKAILQERAFILYLVPWTMFCLVNFFEIPFFDFPLQQYFLGTNLRYLVSIAEFGIGGISALVGGLLSDAIGRKRIIISAYVMVGIGYAVLSFSSVNPIVFYLYLVLDGVSWGIFALMFYLIVWGELALSRPKNKYYLVGILPFLVANFMTFVVEPYIGAIPTFASFSLASFFLFLAVVPLMYAPETLPEKQIKDRELKDYIEKAKRAKEKHP